MPAKPLFKITLENGLANVATSSQKFKVLDENLRFIWKEVKDLSLDDYFVVKADYPEINKLVRLRKKEESQPLYLNSNIAYFLGMFISEGSISNDYSAKKLPRITITNNNIEIIERIVSILDQEFGYKPSIEVNNYRFISAGGATLNNKRYSVRINRKSINEFFADNFNLAGKRALTKEIPQQIFISPKEIISSFISGLIDGDGSIHKNRNIVHYGSISEKLINQIQILLQHQGIFTQKYRDASIKSRYFNGRKINKRYPFYYLEARGENAVSLASSLNPAHKDKNRRALEMGNQKITSFERKGLNKYDIIPYAGRILFQELSKEHIGSGWYQDIDGNKFRMGIKYPAGCKIRYSSDLWEKPLRKTQLIDWGITDKLNRVGSPFFEFLDSIVRNKIYFIKVSSIEKVAPEKTYDFEVEGDHEFIANGMVSHNCLGKYHPHGDQSVYDAMARMTQNFSLRYPLLNGQGNWGSIDDPSEYAAMRYTESRLSKTGEEMLQDINKNTVDFIDNFDATRQEPVVLPSPLPQLLLNGSLGIAVGMATNIPPHNLSEAVDACIYLIDHPKADTEDLFEFVKGPDFPTGGNIYDTKEMIETYSQGKGSIVVRGKAEISEKEKGERVRIIISEIPYQVFKSALIEQLANLVQEKKIDGIKDIRDESDKDGLRIVIDLQKEAYPQKILNRLYKFSDLQKTFHLNMIALVDGIQPRVLSLSEVLSYYLLHRKEVIERRTKFDLEKARERAHILEGLHKCLSKIDQVIKIIKASASREDALKNLMKHFKLTQIQANAILETKLAALAKLERKKIEEELKEIMERIKELTAILKSPEKIKWIIKKELKEVKEKFGDERRTKVHVQKIGEIAEEDLIPQEETIITLTQGGYIKRINPSLYKKQKRGGKGMVGMKTLGDDVVEHFLSAMTHDSLLFFTDSGKVFRTQVYEIPEGARVAKGRGLLNFLELSAEEKVLSLHPMGKEDAEQGIKYLVMVTKNGIIKKTSMEEFENVRKSGLIAISLKKEDALVSCKKTTGEDEIILVSRKGQSIKFKEKDIRPMGRTASGIRGIRLGKGDEVVSMDVISAKSDKNIKEFLLVIMENGFGKRTDVKEYKVQGRGGSGIKTAQITPKTGHIVSAMVLVGDEEDLIVISKKGQVIRTKISLIARL
ncbi:MAG: DNA gyrase subunit A, partial [Candidatus Nealsonbacteria bacterium]|nr:DNA gyrase subunit A [Candidatus Nealsonbacteria bacterium]